MLQRNEKYSLEDGDIFTLVSYTHTHHHTRQATNLGAHLRRFRQGRQLLPVHGVALQPGETR